MGWDGDALAGQMEEAFERQQAVADARALRGTSTLEERMRSSQFETLSDSNCELRMRSSRVEVPRSARASATACCRSNASSICPARASPSHPIIFHLVELMSVW